MKIGAIDIGTNSMRLLVADYVDGKFSNRQKHINTTRIGQGVDKDGFISEDAMAKNISALEEFVNLAKDEECENIFAIGTSALRDSKNKDEFLNDAVSKAKINVEIVSGKEEAYLGFIGVCEGIEEEKDILVIDIGGGSTEFVVGNKKNGIKFSKSENVGALRMTEKFLSSNPIKEYEFNNLEKHVLDTIKNTLDYVNGFNIKQVVGIGGTITSLCAVNQKLETYSMEKVHNSVLYTQEIDDILNLLKGMKLEEKRNLKGLQPKRADIITAGAGILNTIMKYIDSEKIIISEFDNLEGLICQKAKMMS